MTRRPDIVTKYVESRETERLGLPIGQKIGRLDASTYWVLDDRFDHGPYDQLHRQLTVVDAYSAVVDLEENIRGCIDVVIQAFGVEEQYIAATPEFDPLTEPTRGSRQWKPFFAGEELVERVVMNLEEHKQFAAAYGDYVEVARSGDDISRIVADGRIAMVLMLVSGFIADRLDVLGEFYREGIRVMCPSHLSATSWADSCAELNDPPGLTDFGRDVIRTCNELGMLVDLAHCSDYTCRDAIAVATKPMIATHTKAQALSRSLRDMPDDLMREIAEGGGVVCVLAPTPRTPRERHEARRKRDEALHQRYPDPFERARAKLADAEIWGTKLDLVTIDHVVNAVGIDHVGLSSHAQSVPQWKEYTAALIDHGYSETDVAKIMGENVVRVLASA
ncbi:MAG: membrane dipeptidase [Gemmatimonadetes bacterium]|nr:membrane dipeptidase [Gemmatimonadota bacterium]